MVAAHGHSRDGQPSTLGSPRPRHRSESRRHSDWNRDKAVARTGDHRPRALHVGDVVRVFSRLADKWVGAEVVEFVKDHYVRVEYEVGEQWCGKTLHMHSELLDVLAIGSVGSCRLRQKEESLVLGVSVSFLISDFLNEVEHRFGPGADPNYYAINNVMLFGHLARGFGMTCPRDGLLGCSYVDSLDRQHAGPATVMLSWCWQYTVRTVVTALARWCERSGGDTNQTFVWQCALCNNQFRIQENMAQGLTEPFDVFREVFEMRVRTIGHVLALLSPYGNPIYIQRVWCIFELWVAETYGAQIDVVLPEVEELEFWTAFCDSGSSLQQMQRLWAVFRDLKIQDATATVEADRTNILTLVDPQAKTRDDLERSPKVAALNHLVAQKLSTWLADVVRSNVQSRLDSGWTPLPGVLRKTTDLLTGQAGDYEGAEAILGRALHALEASGGDEEQIVEVFLCMADICLWGHTGTRDAEALKLYSKVKDIRETQGVHPPLTLLTNMCMISERQGHHAGVLQLFWQAKAVCQNAGTRMNGGMLHFVGRSYCNEGLYDEAMEFFSQADASFQARGLEFAPTRAWLLGSMGRLLDDQGRHDEALKHILQAKALFETAIAIGHPGYVELMIYIACRARSDP